jgi:hypothetical protein
VSEKAKDLKVKDLEPKAAGHNVKGGCLCCVDVDRVAERNIEEGKSKVRNWLKPR